MFAQFFLSYKGICAWCARIGFEFQMHISDMSLKTAFSIAKEVAFFTLKLDWFCVNFIAMNVKLSLRYCSEITLVARKRLWFGNVFMNSFNMWLQTMSSIADITTFLALIFDSFDMNFIHMSIQSFLSHVPKVAMFTQKLSRFFMNFLNVELENLSCAKSFAT